MNASVASVDKRARIEYVDVFRGLGIILMIMGHIGFGGKFSFIIHAFHMPMFFFISGFLYRPSELSFGRFLLKKAQSLLVPYLSFGLFHFIIWQIINRDDLSFSRLFHLFWTNTESMPIAGSLWFLTALFFADIFYYLINKAAKDIRIVTAAVAALAVAGNVETLILPPLMRLPFAIGPALVGTGLLHIARLLHDYSGNKIINRILNLKWIEWLILSIVSLALTFVNGEINMRMGDYSVIPLFWVNAVLWSISLLNFAKLIDKAFSQKKVFAKCLDFEKNIGKNAIAFVCLNELMIMASKALLGLAFTPGSAAEKAIAQVLKFIIVVGSIWIFDYLIRQTPLKKLLGVK